MKIYPIQTGTVRCKQFQLTGAKNNFSRIYQLIFTQNWGEWMPTYCWLIEKDNELILVDTGETTDIYRKGYLPDGGLYHKAVETRIKEEDELPFQLKKIGYSPKDISTVILTHMHGDHIGGLKHFSHAEIYVSKKEYDFAVSKKGPNMGYFKKNWPSWFQPRLINYTDGSEGVFKESFHLRGEKEIVLVPTPGHSIGHQSIIVKEENKNYFIAGDLTYNVDTLKKEIPDVLLMNKVAKKTVSFVHQYYESTPTVYLSSHDWEAGGMLM